MEENITKKEIKKKSSLNRASQFICIILIVIIFSYIQIGWGFEGTSAPNLHNIGYIILGAIFVYGLFIIIFKKK